MELDLLEKIHLWLQHQVVVGWNGWRWWAESVEESPVQMLVLNLEHHLSARTCWLHHVQVCSSVIWQQPLKHTHRTTECVCVCGVCVWERCDFSVCAPCLSVTVCVCLGHQMLNCPTQEDSRVPPPHTVTMVTPPPFTPVCYHGNPCPFLLLLITMLFFIFLLEVYWSVFVLCSLSE